MMDFKWMEGELTVGKALVIAMGLITVVFVSGGIVASRAFQEIDTVDGKLTHVPDAVEQKFGQLLAQSTAIQVHVDTDIGGLRESLAQSNRDLKLVLDANARDLRTSLDALNGNLTKQVELLNGVQVKMAEFGVEQQHQSATLARMQKISEVSSGPAPDQVAIMYQILRGVGLDTARMSVVNTPKDIFVVPAPDYAMAAAPRLESAGWRRIAANGIDGWKRPN